MLCLSVLRSVPSWTMPRSTGSPPCCSRCCGTLSRAQLPTVLQQTHLQRGADGVGGGAHGSGDHAVGVAGANHHGACWEGGEGEGRVRVGKMQGAIAAMLSTHPLSACHTLDTQKHPVHPPNMLRSCSKSYACSLVSCLALRASTSWSAYLRVREEG